MYEKNVLVKATKKEKETNMSTVRVAQRYQSHPYHLVNPSYWPFLGSWSAFLLLFGTVMYMHNYAYGTLVATIGLVSVLMTMGLWWRDVINEALLGHHTKVVQQGLRYGMILFIVSEVMIFMGFFWSFFHSALAPTVELGCTWPPKGIQVFHPLQIPLLNTLLLLLSGVSVTWSHHAMAANRPKEANWGLLVTILLAITFTVFQGVEYVESPFTLSDGAYGTTFFVCTGLHGAHVFVGTVMLVVSLFRHLKGHFLPDHHIGYLCAH